MIEEIIKEEDMNTATVRTSPGLKIEVEKAIKEMLSSNKNELKFTLPGTSVSFLLIRKGSESEKVRESDPGALAGIEYLVKENTFMLARR